MPTLIALITIKPILRPENHPTKQGRHSLASLLIFTPSLTLTLKICMLYWGIVYIFLKGDDPMPLYEYQCNDCGEEFEKMVRFSEANHSPICPSCQSQDTSKKISKIASFGGSLGGTSASTGSNCGSSGGFS
jgi:putative FmdB family regulatory protein